MGYVCTYWTLDSGLPLVVISMGVCHGIAMSFVYGQTLGAVMKVIQKRFYFVCTVREMIPYLSGSPATPD